MIAFIEKIGDKTLQYTNESINFFLFFIRSFVFISAPSSYNRASKRVFIKQMYISTIKILPVFTLFALFFGSIFIVITVLFAINFNIQDKIGTLVVTFVLNEFAPLFTTLFITFRYRYLITTKRTAHTDIIKQFTTNYTAKLLNSLLSIPSMALFFATIILISGYVVSSIYLNIDLATYRELIISAISLNNILILLVKSMTFGFLTTLIPLYFSHKTTYRSNSAKSIIDIFVTILIVLFSLEILSLIILY